MGSTPHAATGQARGARSECNNGQQSHDRLLTQAGPSARRPYISLGHGLFAGKAAPIIPKKQARCHEVGIPRAKTRLEKRRRGCCQWATANTNFASAPRDQITPQHAVKLPKRRQEQGDPPAEKRLAEKHGKSGAKNKEEVHAFSDMEWTSKTARSGSRRRDIDLSEEARERWHPDRQVGLEGKS